VNNGKGRAEGPGGELGSFRDAFYREETRPTLLLFVGISSKKDSLRKGPGTLSAPQEGFMSLGEQGGTVHGLPFKRE